MVWLLVSLLSSIVWVVYITFYNARVVGCVITKLANRLYVRGAYFKIGALNVNPLAGKIMFRDVVYVCFDYTVRIQDGYANLRSSRPYIPKEITEDQNNSDTRLSVMLNGFEMHIYNRSDLYARLEKTFGLKPSVLVPTEDMSAEEIARFKEQMMNDENQRHSSEPAAKIKKPRPEAMTATTWRDLIPVIKNHSGKRRAPLNNQPTPTTQTNEPKETQSLNKTKTAHTKTDHIIHYTKEKEENANEHITTSPNETRKANKPTKNTTQGPLMTMTNPTKPHNHTHKAAQKPQKTRKPTKAKREETKPKQTLKTTNKKSPKATNASDGPGPERQHEHPRQSFETKN
uniref:Putative secreted protein n=1 Tax=Anopheles darlingi TaxID=43151 RepID=A0A2M4DQM2_ANODA